MPTQANAALPSALDPPPDDYVPEAVYWERYYEEPDVHYEWNNGRLEEKPVSDYLTGQTYLWFVLLLQHFLTARPIAKMIGLEMGFRLALPTKTVIRKPDLGVVHNDNPVPIRPLDNVYRGVFDLCVEGLSDSNRANALRDQVTKKGEYAAGGVKEYYILHRDEDKQAFYTLTARGVYVPIRPVAGVVHSRVLPGFRFRVTDLTRRPELNGLRGDPLYRDFLMPGWVAAEERAEAAEQKAEAAEARAEAATAELARLRALLAKGSKSS